MSLVRRDLLDALSSRRSRSLPFRVPSTVPIPAQATDIEIHAREIVALRERLVDLYAGHCGKPADTIAQALERDHFMSAEKAREFGLIDEVVHRREADSPENGPPDASGTR